MTVNIILLKAIATALLDQNLMRKQCYLQLRIPTFIFIGFAIHEDYHYSQSVTVSISTSPYESFCINAFEIVVRGIAIEPQC